MKNLVYAAACGLALVLASTPAGSGASRSTGPKLEMIFQQQTEDHWQVFLFGLPSCSKALVIQPKDASEPVEVRCGR